MYAVAQCRVAGAVIDLIYPGVESGRVRLAPEKINVLLAYEEICACDRIVRRSRAFGVGNCNGSHIRRAENGTAWISERDHEGFAALGISIIYKRNRDRLRSFSRSEP